MRRPPKSSPANNARDSFLCQYDLRAAIRFKEPERLADVDVHRLQGAFAVIAGDHR